MRSINRRSSQYHILSTRSIHEFFLDQLDQGLTTERFAKVVGSRTFDTDGRQWFMRRKCWENLAEYLIENQRCGIFVED